MIMKILTGQGDDYTTEFLLDYQCFKGHYQLIVVDLSKQKELDADPRVIKANRIFWNVRNQNTRMHNFIKVKRNSPRTLQRNSKGFVNKCIIVLWLV